MSSDVDQPSGYSAEVGTQTDAQSEAVTASDGDCGGHQNNHDHEEFASDFDRLTAGHLRSAIQDYKADLAYCEDQLQRGPKYLTPSEIRAFKLRTLDLGHQLRNANQRLEVMQFCNRNNNSTGSNNVNRAAQASDGGLDLPHKRRKSQVQSNAGNPIPADNVLAVVPPSLPITEVGRTGFWNCHFCNGAKNNKHEMAGANRKPGQAIKWPLKDIARMIFHYTAQHGEQTDQDRCIELGQALEANPGPWEHYIRKTRKVSLDKHPDVLRSLVDELLAGRMPAGLRGYSTAAADFPGQ